MSIQNIITNIGDALQARDRNSVTVLKSLMQNAIGEAKSNWASLWDGGFVGIDAKNVSILEEELKETINKVKEIADNFNAEQSFDAALAGEAKVATTEYVAAVKELLNAFVSTYNNFIELANNAAAKMQEGDTDNATSIRAAADEIRARASEIRVD